MNFARFYSLIYLIFLFNLTCLAQLPTEWSNWSPTGRNSSRVMRTRTCSLNDVDNCVSYEETDESCTIDCFVTGFLYTGSRSFSICTGDCHFGMNERTLDCFNSTGLSCTVLQRQACFGGTPRCLTGSWGEWTLNGEICTSGGDISRSVTRYCVSDNLSCPVQTTGGPQRSNSVINCFVATTTASSTTVRPPTTTTTTSIQTSTCDTTFDWGEWSVWSVCVSSMQQRIRLNLKQPLCSGIASNETTAQACETGLNLSQSQIVILSVSLGAGVILLVAVIVIVVAHFRRCGRKPKLNTRTTTINLPLPPIPEEEPTRLSTVPEIAAGSSNSSETSGSVFTDTETATIPHVNCTSKFNTPRNRQAHYDQSQRRLPSLPYSLPFDSIIKLEKEMGLEPGYDSLHHD